MERMALREDHYCIILTFLYILGQGDCIFIGEKSENFWKLMSVATITWSTVQYSTFFPFNFLVYFCIQSTGNTDNEDICYEFKQEQDLIHRTHLYYMDYDFSPVSIQSVTECSTKNKQFFLSVLTGPCLFIQIIKFLQIWGLFINWYKKKIFSNVCLVSPTYSPIACLLTKWV